MHQSYDAILIVGFGGPEHPDDVIPFLENVTRGRNIPRERLQEVAAHYDHFGGVSPINDQVRELIDALQEELERHQIAVTLYWGNRNWHPLLATTLQKMKDERVERALALVLSGYGSYSSCRQYRENIEEARTAVDCEPPVVDKIRVFYNHPSFIEANADRLSSALQQLPVDRQKSARIAFTAHSIPQSMADSCDYALQLEETCRLVSDSLEVKSENWQLVYQSRSGRPSDPWLEPDILDYLTTVAGAGATDVVIMPIGFLSDHVEVLYDLDYEAQNKCSQLGLRLVRAATVGTHPKFVSMLRELIQERMTDNLERRSIGRFAASHDCCPDDCCLYPIVHRKSENG